MAAPKISLRKIADLKPDPRNARTHSPEQVDQLVASIQRFGWTNPILTDDMIRAGHGRLMAASKIYEAGGKIFTAPGEQHGGSALPAGTVPVIDCTGWDEDERRAYALADNQLALQAGWDIDELSAQLAELADLNFDFPTIGFDAEALEALEAISAAGQDGGAGGGGAGELEDSTFAHCDQYAVIVRCSGEAEQEAIFNRLRDEYGADNVKVVVV